MSAGLSGSTLVRLLARLAGKEVREPPQATADRLGDWLGWTDAISLSAVLNGGPAQAGAGARTGIEAEERECVRVRAALTKTLAEGNAFTSDFALYRQCYLARQQAMETAIGPLRARLRAKLATHSPDMARLATVDAVMDQALGAREHALLGTVPVVLERHFKRLRQSVPALHDADATDPGDVHPEAWLQTFRQDFQALLLAELEHRFQPVEGLLEALRAKQTTR